MPTSITPAPVTVTIPSVDIVSSAALYFNSPPSAMAIFVAAMLLFILSLPVAVTATSFSSFAPITPIGPVTVFTPVDVKVPLSAAAFVTAPLISAPVPSSTNPVVPAKSTAVVTVISSSAPIINL